MTYPRQDDSTADESALAGYLDEARRIISAAPCGTGSAAADVDEPLPGVSADFEHLRWFELPAGCLR